MRDRNVYNADAIAVIGIAGKFPGADDVQAFWNNLVNGIESIRQFSVEELLESGLIDPGLVCRPDYVKAKGYLDNATQFSARSFGLSEKKAQLMDPQFRLFLECVWQAFEDAGYDPKKVNAVVGVYATSSTEDSYYHKNLLANAELTEEVDSYDLLISNAKDFMATLVAYYLNFQGPCINIQTACSSSLVAICEACDALLLGECELAVAGGMSISFPLKGGYLHRSGMIFSKDGHCKPFSTDATGIVRGNGGGAIVLKLLSKAKSDGDHIYGVIKGYAVNNDGRNKLSYTAPGIDGQHKAVLAAAEMADIDPSEVQYIEAHGTGTRLGDQIEIAAVQRFLSSGAKKRQKPCVIGSVKANIGHLDVAAGIAGFIKAVLILKTDIIPKSLHVDSVHSALLANEFLAVASENTLLSSSTAGKPYVGVSSFGVGGTNAHIIITATDAGAPYKGIFPSVLVGHKNYCIDPPRLYKLEMPSQNLNKQALPGLELLHVLSWVKSQPVQNCLHKNKAFLIVQDVAGYCHDIFNSFVNEHGYFETTIVPAPKPQKVMTEAWLIERAHQWLKFFARIKDNLVLYIIHLAHAESAVNASNWQEAMIPNFYDFIALAKAIHQSGWGKPVKIISLGSGLAQVTHGESIHPWVSVLFGPLYCLPAEYPFVTAVGVDVGMPVTRVNLLDCLFKELTISDTEHIVAYRKGVRYVMTNTQVIETRQKEIKPLAFRQGGVYLITGGLGGIGLTVALYLAKRYKAKLILISRTPVPPKEIWKDHSELKSLLLVLQKTDDLLIFSADASDQEAMQALVAEAVKKWGQINGVIHAASSYPQGLVANKSLTDMTNMFKSKIIALTVLESILKDQPVDFILLCSALNTYQGSPGAIDYIAANAYMDAYVKSKRSNPAPIISINWDAWKETGMRYRAEEKLKWQSLIPLSLETLRWKRLILEHQINERLVVPGSMLIDMLLQQLLLKQGKKLPIHLEGIAFMHMGAFDSIDEAKLFFSKQNSILKIEQQVGGVLTPICQGTLSNQNNSVSSIDLNQIKKLKQVNEISLKALSGKIIMLGERWNCLKWVKQEQDTYFAAVSLPENFSQELKDYILHPALLDIAYSFHVNLQEGQYVPFYIQRLSVFAKLPQTFYSLIQVNPSHLNSGSLTCRVRLIDEANNLLVDLEGFSLKRLGFEGGKKNDQV